VVHRITFSLSCFIYSFYSWYHKWSDISSKTTRLFLANWHSHFSVLPHNITLLRDCFRTTVLTPVNYSLRRLNLSPSTYNQRLWHIRWQIKPKTYGYQPSVTDTSNPKKQIQMFGYIINIISRSDIQLGWRILSRERSEIGRLLAGSWMLQGIRKTQAKKGARFVYVNSTLYSYDWTV